MNGPPPPLSSIPGPFAEWVSGLQVGDTQLHNCDGERHHYVPEFMLRRFHGTGRTIFQLDKHDGGCSEVKPKDAAWEDGLYKVESITGQHDGIIEGLFSIAETFAAPSLSRLLSDRANFTDADRGNLAFLLAIQEQRVPSSLDEWSENLAMMMTVWVATEFDNQRGSKADQRQARQAVRELVDGSINIKPTRENLLQTVLLGVARTAPVVYALPWTLLEADQASFVCSDRPLTMSDPMPPHKFAAPAWISSPLAYATMPLSAKVCLRIGQNGPSRFAERKVVKQVQHVNMRTYGWAARYVYGPSRAGLEEIHALAVADPDRAPAPIKKRLVLIEDASNADPAVAERNAARGWDRHVAMHGDDGSQRLMSYEVIETIEDARRAAARSRSGPDNEQ